MIEQDFLQRYGITEYKVIRKFFSKKNDVYHIRAIHNNKLRDYVLKYFRNGKNKKTKEASVLHLLQRLDINAPHVICGCEKSMLLEYVPGNTLLDVYCNEEKISKENCLDPSAYNMINHICCWMENFYYKTRKELGYQLILGDTNFRNFILSNDLTGIDFEEVHRGEIEEDIGQICAFALTYFNMFTPWKLQFAGCLADRFTADLSLDYELIRRYMKDELNTICCRRNM